MHEKSAYFEKEMVTKGCQIIEQGALNKFIYLVCKGKVNVLHAPSGLPDHVKQPNQH